MADRIAILGAGAVGGMLGVLLAQAGHDITMLASGRTSTAININGLTLHSRPYGELHAQIPARPWLTTPVDVLFITVKSPDLLAALTRVPASLLHGAAVVPLLNGVDHGPLLRAALPQATAVPMTVSVEATRVEPGVIEHLYPFADYAICPRHQPVPVDPATVLRSAGLNVDSSAPDETTLLWRKLSFLAPFALLTTSARLPLGPAPASPARPAHPAGRRNRSRCGGQQRRGRRRRGPRAFAPTPRRNAVVHAQRRPSRVHMELDAIAGPVLRAISNGARHGQRSRRHHPRPQPAHIGQTP